jgi:putative ABC transport system permease protein
LEQTGDGEERAPQSRTEGGPVSAGQRVRAYIGHFALLAALAMVAALLLTATPRIANHLADRGLRGYLGGLPAPVHDFTYRSYAERGSTPPGFKPASRVAELDTLEEAMPDELRRLVERRWYAGQAGPTSVTATGPDLPPTGARVDFGLRSVSGAHEAVTVIDGRWPVESTGSAPVEVAVSAKVASTLGLRVGSRLRLAYSGLPPAGPGVVVAGIFQPRDPADAIWELAPTVLDPYVPVNDGDPFVAVALTTDGAISACQAAGFPIVFSWRYRMDTDRLDASDAEPVITAIRQLDQKLPSELALTRGLDTALHRFVGSLASVRALLAMVSAGVLASLCGLIALAARLAVDRRREEFALVRARGGALVGVGGRCVAESLLVIPVAVLVGWSAGAAVPGRPADTGWLVVVAAAATVLALPVTAVATRTSVAGRRDAVTGRSSARRLTMEVSVLAFAALSALLLRRRGLSSTGSVDPLLVTVPVLLAVAAAVLALRAYPWPLRIVALLATRARGAAAFLGVARAGRSAASTGPLIVLVVAAAVATFCGVIAAGIAAGRDRAAELKVPADALITGGRFAPDTAAALGASAGVRAVTPIAAEANQRIAPTDRLANELGRVFVLAVDGPTFVRVAAESGVDAALPPALASAAAGTGPVPALVSPSVAADLDGRGFTSLQDRLFEFRVAAVARSFPTVGGSIKRFLVLPWQALPVAADRPIVPTGFLLAASSVDESMLREVGDQGQRRWLSAGSVTGTGIPPETDVLVRSAYRSSLDTGGVNGLLSFAFVAGTIGGGVLGLLAVAFAVVAGARARGRVLSRLRTMGLSYRQWRGLLAFELAPLVGVAILTGAAVGALLPLLLTPVLELSAFTDGVPVQARFEADVVAGVAGLGLLALATAVAVEALNNRRLRLGEVLRLEERS